MGGQGSSGVGEDGLPDVILCFPGVDKGTECTQGLIHLESEVL